MLTGNFYRRSLLVAAALVLPVISSGCAARVGVGVGYRSYDPYHTDYHVWDDHERVYYNNWVVETHRDAHRDYRKLKKDEQKQYWDWRHNHQ
jgi:hypothetical protein